MKRKPAPSGNARAETHKAVPGPDPLYPRVTHEDALVISLQRQIDVDLWKRGEAYHPALAKKMVLTGANRRMANNRTTKQIIAKKAELRRKIANSEQLVHDFEFFTVALGWDPETLLQYLYWDSNMMQADPQTVIGNEKRSTWPIDRDALSQIRKNLQVLTEEISRLNKTDLSPLRSVILRDEEGMRLSPSDERYFLRAFSELPVVLHFYSLEFNRRLALTDLIWSKDKESLRSSVELARKTSLYERIRAKTGRYHAVRLHRLVNTSRQIQGLPAIKERAFVIWLNRLKKRHEAESIPQAHSQSDTGSQPPQPSQSL